jgi:peptide/nickel transport system permease protein
MILGRLAQGVGLVLFVSFLAYVIVYQMGNPADVLASPNATAEDMARVVHDFGLDKPFLSQYLIFLKRIFTGDFGQSFIVGEPAMSVIAGRFPATLELAISAVFIATVVGVPLGVLAGAYPKALLSRFAINLSILGISVPLFWMGLLLIMIFAVWLGVVPAGGRGEVGAFLGIRSSLFTLDGLHHIILPAATLAISQTVLFFRLANAGTREALSSDYIKFARTKGAGERRILARHVLPNILIPLVTVGGLELGSVLVFAAVTETIFAWPGMGKLMIDSIGLLDRPVITAYLMLTVFIVILVNLAVDLLNLWLDPRLRTRAR